MPQKTHNTRGSSKKNKLVIRFKKFKPIIEDQSIVTTTPEPIISLPSIFDIPISPTLVSINISFPNYSAKEIIKRYYPHIIYDILTENEINETLKNIQMLIQTYDVISPGLRASDAEPIDLSEFQLN